MPLRHQFKRRAVKIKTAEVVRQPLPIILVPHNGPLRQKITRIRVSCVVRHRPRQQLPLAVQFDGPSGDRRFVHRRCNRKRLLPRNHSRAQKKRNQRSCQSKSSTCNRSGAVGSVIHNEGRRADRFEPRGGRAESTRSGLPTQQWPPRQRTWRGRWRRRQGFG